MENAAHLIVNSLDAISRARESLLTGLDSKRDTSWVMYGYPEEVTFDAMLRAYERTGAGHGAVHRILDKCWSEWPRIKADDGRDEESEWEAKLSAKMKRLWPKLMDFDRRNMVGRFAALIYRVGDGKALREPLDKAQRLVDLVPVYESQIRVQSWVEDETAEDYGMPSMYQYRTRPVSIGDTQARPETWIDVHPSRVQILAEGSVGDMFDGVPLLRAGFNKLVDLEKIEGGSAEGVFKNSARATVVEFSADANVVQATQSGKQLTGSTETNVADVVEQQIRSLNKSHDAAMMLQGAKAYPLTVALSDPRGAWEIAANEFAASVRIPFTILFGQQTGRLASDEDKADHAARCEKRQETELTPMLEQLITRLQAAGLVDEGAFVVEWPDLSAPSDEQKLDNLNKMVAAMKTAFDAGAPGLFETDELRRVAGYDPLTMPDLPAEGADPLPNA